MQPQLPRPLWKNIRHYFPQDNSVILCGWQEPTGANLWRFSLCPQSHHSIPKEWLSAPSACNAHDLPSIGKLVCYLHAAARFPVKFTWLADIHAGNFTSWPGLTLANSAQYCPSSVKSLKGHLTQSRKVIRSKKKKS